MDLLNQIIQQTTAVGATALPVSFPLSGNFETVQPAYRRAMLIVETILGLLMPNHVRFFLLLFWINIKPQPR